MMRSRVLLLILAFLIVPGAGMPAILVHHGTAGGGVTPPVNPCPAGAPNSNSCAAVQATVASNSLCTVLTPFVVEIGNNTGPLFSTTGGTQYGATSGNAGSPPYACPGSGIGTHKNGCPPSTNITSLSTSATWASASKWLYGAYVAQLYGGPANVPSPQQPFMNFTSGYVSMSTTGTACSGTANINACLAQSNASGVPYTTQTPGFVGFFDYDSAHFENHAGQFGSAINTLGASVNNRALSNAIFGTLGLSPTPTAFYANPLLAGALYGPGTDYRTVLKAIVSHSLAISADLAYNAACTQGGDTYTVDANGNSVTPYVCQQGAATYGGSPLAPDHDYYSFGHWIEADPRVNADFARSSAGAYGLYPWIEKSLAYYGILYRTAQPQYYSLGQQGKSSMQCGRLLRCAWDSGQTQSGSIPSPSCAP